MTLPRCPHCRKLFQPEPHNAWHQKYCTQDACQKARNRISCRRWRLNHPEDCDNNDDHRVEAWRAQHPGYWRRERRKFLSVDILLPTCRKVDCGVGMRICDREGITLQHVALKWTPEWQVVCRDMGLTLQNVVAGLKIRGYRLGHDGKRFPYYTFLRQLHVYANRAGVSVNVTPHTFRRSCTTELLRGDANMYHVKELLGHESLDTLKHYAKLTILDLKKEHHRCHPREREEREGLAGFA